MDRPVNFRSALCLQVFNLSAGRHRQDSIILLEIDMKPVLTIAVSITIAVSGMAIVGCESNNRASTSTNDNVMAGGNGAFGESPERPGAYNNDRGIRANSPSDSSSNHAGADRQ